MKKACHALLKVGLSLSIVGIALMLLMAIICFAGGGIAAASGNPGAQGGSIVSGMTGIVYLLMVPYFVVGIVLSAIGLKKTEANMETVGFGVCLIIFAFAPAGILYIICAVNQNNQNVVVVKEE